MVLTTTCTEVPKQILDTLCCSNNVLDSGDYFVPLHQQSEADIILQFNSNQLPVKASGSLGSKLVPTLCYHPVIPPQAIRFRFFSIPSFIYAGTSVGSFVTSHTPCDTQGIPVTVPLHALTAKYPPSSVNITGPQHVDTQKYSPPL